MLKLTEALPRTYLGAIARRFATTILFVLAVGIAFGQASLTYRDVHDFTGNSGSGDGLLPYGNITFDSAGNAYGTAWAGGINDMGMVWEVTAAGAFVVVHSFGGTITNANGTNGPDGVHPYAGVTVDSQGNLFGTTTYGGAVVTDFGGDGMVWEVTSSGAYKDLHDFGQTVINANGSSGPDGINPYCAVAFDSSDNMYGTAFNGGANNASGGGSGMLWEITESGTYKDVHDFGGTITFADDSTGSDGFDPYAGVTITSANNIFGTAESGGENEGGIAWEVTSAGAYKDIHDFGGTITNADGQSGPDGDDPQAGVSFDNRGNMYGTTYDGGPNFSLILDQDGGIVWEITSGGAYKDLHDFGGTVTVSNGTSGQDGAFPVGGVTADSAGNLYGTTSLGGGTNGVGMVWELTSSGVYKDLHDFGGTVTLSDGSTGTDATNPNGGVTLDPVGNVCGTAGMGGPINDGNIWELAHLPKISSLTLSPSTIGGFGASTGTITLNSATPFGGWSVSVHPGASGYLTMPSSVSPSVGASSVTFAIDGLAQRPSTIKMGIFASDATSSVETILTIQGDHLTGFTLSPAQIKWTSGTSTATVTVATAAPPGGWLVALKPGVSGYVNIPNYVTIPAGSTSTTFTITGNALRFFTLNLGIIATDYGSQLSSTLVIAGDAVKSLSVSPSAIGWGGTSTATITLVAAAPPGGWLVNTNPGAKGYVTMPSSVIVPAGATSATFTITAGSQRSQTLNLGIYANDGPSNQSAILTIQGDSVKSLTLNPSSISWTGASTATVTLGSAAPPGGWVLKLSAGASGYVTMPATITVPAGATSATFTITAGSARSSTINLGIFATDGNSTQEAILTIT